MMTESDKALVEAMKDAVLHGAGFLKNGKHVPIEDVYVDPRDARIEALSAQLHTVLDREAETHRRHDAKVEALSAENEKLREELDWIANIAEVNFEQDDKLRARGARVLSRISIRARAALGETK